MNNQLAQAIVRVATTPMSATAIAQKVGKSKGYMIQDELESLVNDGTLIADDSGKFTTYKVASRVSVSNSNRQNTQVVDSEIPVQQRVPAGYSVSKRIVRKSDKAKGHIITLPGDKGKVFVEDGFSLLVINGEAVKCVKTATTALSVISEYAANHGMTPFTVKNTLTGTIGKVEDIQSYSGIIDVTITKNNKAA